MGVVTMLAADFVILVQLLIKLFYFTLALWSKNIFVPSRYLYKSLEGEIVLITGAGNFFN